MSSRTDPKRLAELRRLLILDSRPEHDFDAITEQLSRVFDVPIAMVNFLDERRDWFKSCIGMPLTESPVESSFCESVFQSDAAVIVAEDTTRDSRFSSNPFVTGEPHIRFYASARLVVNGQTVGTLCAYDLAPHQVSQTQIEDLTAMANAVVESAVERATLQRSLPSAQQPDNNDDEDNQSPEEGADE